MRALSAMPERVPLVVSGDLHATAEGRMLRSGGHDFSGRPVVAVLPGTLGTSDGGWASEFRGVGPLPPRHLEMDETVRPIEENGFTLIDLTPVAVTLRYFRWNQKTQPVEAIDGLEPFHTTELKRGCHALRAPRRRDRGLLRRATAPGQRVAPGPRIVPRPAVCEWGPRPSR